MATHQDWLLSAIFQLSYTLLTGAVGAAKHSALRLDAMPDYLAAAMFTNRRKLVNRTFKAVKDMSIAYRDDFERQIVFVTTYFALCH